MRTFDMPIRPHTRVVIRDVSGVVASDFDVNTPHTAVIETMDPFQQGWRASTPDDFRALLSYVLDGADWRALFDVNVRRAAGL